MLLRTRRLKIRRVGMAGHEAARCLPAFRRQDRDGQAGLVVAGVPVLLVLGAGQAMWLLALAVMAANGFVAGFISLLDQLGYPVGVLDSLWMAGILLLQVVFGLYGNAWRAVHLLRRGYVLESPQAPSAWPVVPR
ncbi:MAG: hypothetical protein OXG04_28775 [Acidobacteria bacterium]|nr:hypothetical protein [Acidobacteriota bacterium]